MPSAGAELYCHMLPVCLYLIIPHYLKSHDLQKKLLNIKCVLWFSLQTSSETFLILGASRNVMAHAQKPDFVFRRNGRVHLNLRRGGQFSQLLAAEVCASTVVMLDTPCSEVVWRVLATHSIRQFPLHFPSRASPCAITFQLESTKNSLRYNHICIIVFMSSTHFSCQILAKIEISWHIFEKYSNIKFHWNPSRGSRVV